MGGIPRHILMRVAVGLLIGIGMFHYREAMAQNPCPPNHTPFYESRAIQNNSELNPSPYPCGDVGPGGKRGRKQEDMFSCFRPAGTQRVDVNGNATRLMAPEKHPTDPLLIRQPREFILNGSSTGVQGHDDMTLVLICVPQQCSLPEGTKKRFEGENSPDGPPETICEDGCSYKTFEVGAAFGTGIWSGGYESDGLACEGSDGHQQDAYDPEEPHCQTIQGKQVCNVPDQPLCITVDGSLSCTDHGAGGFCTTPECQAIANAVTNPAGAVLAADPADAAPVPYMSATTERNPDATFNIRRPGGNGQPSNTSRVDYYSPSTVENSCSGPCAPNQQPGEDEPEEPEIDLEGDECEEGEDCGTDKGEGSFKGRGGTARTFGKSLQAVSSAWENSPANQKLAGLSIPSGGTCPSPSISMPYLRTTVTMDAHCTVAEGIRGELRAVFLAIWLIIAVGVFLRP